MIDKDSEIVKEIQQRLDDLPDEELVVYNTIVKILNVLTSVSGILSILFIMMFPGPILILSMLFTLYWSFKLNMGATLASNLIVQTINSRENKR